MRACRWPPIHALAEVGRRIELEAGCMEDREFREANRRPRKTLFCDFVLDPGKGGGGAT